MEKIKVLLLLLMISVGANGQSGDTIVTCDKAICFSLDSVTIRLPVYKVHSMPKEYYEARDRADLAMYHYLMEQRKWLIKNGANPKELVMPIKPFITSLP